MNDNKKLTSAERVGSAGHGDVPRYSAMPPRTREAWIRTYTGRILRCWFHQPTALGLAWTYANWIHRQLAESYSDPLKKAFIEQTYRATRRRKD